MPGQEIPAIGLPRPQISFQVRRRVSIQIFLGQLAEGHIQT
jgi:hypothetical protein